MKASEIVLAMETDLLVVSLSIEPLRPFQKKLAEEHIKTLEKMLETRHVLVEKDFTKAKQGHERQIVTYKV